MKKKGNVVLLGCGIVFLLISLLGCQADPQMYSVTFDSKGATTATDPTSIIVTAPATTVGVLPTEPEKTDDIFGGWYTAKSGVGTEFTETTQITGDKIE